MDVVAAVVGAWMARCGVRGFVDVDLKTCLLERLVDDGQGGVELASRRGGV